MTERESSNVRLPEWMLALPSDLDPSTVYGPFRALLDHLPMPKAELARELGVSRATVSNWASGETRPADLRTMIRAIQVVRRRVGEIEARLSEAEALLGAVEDVVEADRRYQETRSVDALSDLRVVQEALEELR